LLIEFAAAPDTRYYAHEMVMRTFILAGARFSLSLWVVLASVWGMSTMPEEGIYAQYPCRDGGGGLRFVRQGSEEYTKNIRHRGSPTPPKAASARGAVLAPRSLRDGHYMLTLESPGGSTIITTVLQRLVNDLDFG
jgi:hypothetical protein